MEWLKELLKSATVTDGKLDVDAVMENIKKEFPNHAVPKTEFNAKTDALKAKDAELQTANKTIEELKKANGDNKALQKQIEEYKAQVKTLQETADETARTYALKETLTKEGVIDPDYLIYKTGGVDKFTFDKEGKPIGVTDVLKPYRDDEATKHLFKQEPGADYTPKGGNGGQTVNPFAKETYNLTEQGKLLRENPEQARVLAQAAGVTI